MNFRTALAVISCLCMSPPASADMLLTGVGGAAFSPANIPGLTLAWRPDQGVTTDGNGITGITGAYGTSVSLTGGPTTQEPDLVANVGAFAGQPLIHFTSSRTEYFSLPAQTFTAFTMLMVISPDSLTGALSLWGKSTVPTTILQTANTGNRLQYRATTGTGTITQTLATNLVKSLQVLAITFDGSAAGGTVIAYQNCGAAEPAATAVGDSYTLDRIGVTSTATNPYSGYMGPILVWNRVLPAPQMAAACNFISNAWRPLYLYAANSGSSASTTPWLQSTPLDSIPTMVGILRRGQTGAPKGGDIFRSGSTKVIISVPGDANASIGIDGSVWGSGKAQMRWSSAATPTLSSGTVYSLGVQTAKPVGYVFYVPGGTPTFGTRAQLYASNVVRLTEDAGSPTSPASGKWGWDGGTSTLYANAGVALSAGDIEVSTPTLVNVFYLNQPYWSIRNLVTAFAEDKGFDNDGASHVRWSGLESWFNQSDGMDAFQATTDFDIDNTFSAYNGRVPTAVGGFGDCISFHDTVQATVSDITCVDNDKSGNNGHSGQTSTFDRMWAYGTLPFSLSEDSGLIGSMTITNSIGIVKSGAPTTNCAQNTALGAATLILEGVTCIAQTPGEGTGLFKTTSSSIVVLKDTILSNFATAVTGTNSGTAAGYTGNHNLYFGNTANFGSGYASGTGDVFADPLFVASPGNLAVGLASPAIGAGITIPGLTTDFTGAPRAHPPTIGAYEQ